MGVSVPHRASESHGFTEKSWGSGEVTRYLHGGAHAAAPESVGVEPNLTELALISAAPTETGANPNSSGVDLPKDFFDLSPWDGDPRVVQCFVNRFGVDDQGNLTVYTWRPHSDMPPALHRNGLLVFNDGDPKPGAPTTMNLPSAYRAELTGDARNLLAKTGDGELFVVWKLFMYYDFGVVTDEHLPKLWHPPIPDDLTGLQRRVWERAYLRARLWQPFPFSHQFGKESVGYDGDRRHLGRVLERFRELGLLHCVDKWACPLVPNKETGELVKVREDANLYVIGDGTPDPTLRPRRWKPAE